MDNGPSSDLSLRPIQRIDAKTFGRGTWVERTNKNNSTVYIKRSISGSSRFGNVAASAWDGCFGGTRQIKRGDWNWSSYGSAWESFCNGTMVWLEHKIWASWLQPGQLWLRCQDWTDLLGWSIVALVMNSCCCRRRSRDRQTWFEYRSCSLGQLLLLYKDWAGPIESS